MPRKKAAKPVPTPTGDGWHLADQPTRGPVVIQLVGLLMGGPHPLDGQYVVSFHPGPASMPLGQCRLVGTREIGRAKRYASHADAHAEWTRVDPRAPVRADGRPNRPMTAWNVMFLEVPA